MKTLSTKQVAVVTSTLATIKEISAEKVEEVGRIIAEYKLSLQGKLRQDTAGCNLPVLKNLQWRADIEVSSRECKKSFKPTFLLGLDFEYPTGETKTFCMNSDAGTLKKLGDEMKYAHAFPRSITYRKLNRGLK